MKYLPDLSCKDQSFLIQQKKQFTQPFGFLILAVYQPQL